MLHVASTLFVIFLVVQVSRAILESRSGCDLRGAERVLIINGIFNLNTISPRIDDSVQSLLPRIFKYCSRVIFETRRAWNNHAANTSLVFLKAHTDEGYA